MNSFKDKNILILGAGQIGYAVFNELMKKNCNKIVLHSYTLQEIEVIKKRTEKINSKSTIEYEYGDLYQVTTITNMVDVYSTFLYKVCARWDIDIIIDCINSAAVLGEQLDDLNKQIINYERPDNSLNVYEKINNFIITLKEVYREFNLIKYIKVSTTGLGGMGLNMGYTHGDTQGFCLSPDILGKLQVAGAFHQLLWALNHTPDYNISVIIPAACIGWENISNERMPTCKEEVIKSAIDLGQFTGKITLCTVDNEIDVTQVYLGENNSYAREEVALLTQVNQMEFISKETIAKIVVEDLLGENTKYNLLNTMDYSMIGPSYNDFYLREDLIKQLDTKAKDTSVESLITNNLGREVSKDICELFIIKQLLAGDIDKIDNILCMDEKIIQKQIKEFLNEYTDYKSYFLSANYGILFDNELWMERQRSEQNYINIINYTSRNIKRILNELKKVVRAFSLGDSSFQKYSKSILSSKDFEIGEILGILYSFEGKGRELLTYAYDIKEIIV